MANTPHTEAIDLSKFTGIDGETPIFQGVVELIKVERFVLWYIKSDNDRGLEIIR